MKQFSIFLCGMFYFLLKTFDFILIDVFEKSNERIFSFENCQFNEKKISRSVSYLATTTLNSNRLN